MGAQSGQMLSHYRLVKKIGEGGMGVVWKAEDTVLSRAVAIKVLAADLALVEERRRMFVEEARLAASVSHGNIVQVHELGREGNLDFIVMEHIEGRPLSKILHGRPLPPDKVAKLGLQVARGLTQAHRKSLIHRDLKPANILVTPDGDVKIVDFGLATLFAESESTTATLTSTVEADDRARIVGTVPYMSPEQVRGEKPDARSDIFSLGVVLYEMATGQRPFTGARPADVAANILKSQPRPVHELVPNVPLDLHRIIEKSLARRPRDRYQHIDDMVVDLRRLERDLDSGSSPSYGDLKVMTEPRRLRRLPAFAALSLAVLAVLTWQIWLRRGTDLSQPVLLVLPFEMRGTSQGEDYAGVALAEAVALGIAQAESIHVLPVPDAGELAGHTRERTLAAQNMGATYLLSGALTVIDGGLKTTMSLLDVSANRVVWGMQDDKSDRSLESLAALLTRDLGRQLGLTFPHLYDMPGKLMGSPKMAASWELADAQGAFQRVDLQEYLAATERLVDIFPEERDAHFRRLQAYSWAARVQPTAENLAKLEDAIESAMRIDPSNPYAAMVRVSVQDPSYATDSAATRADLIEALNRLLDRNDLAASLRSYVLVMRATQLSTIGKATAAERDLEEAVALTPLDVNVYHGLTYVRRMNGNLDEALLSARHAMALDPNWLSHVLLGETLRLLARYAESVVALKPVYEMDRRYHGNPEPQRVRAQYAMALHATGRRSEAMGIAEEGEALEDRPDGVYHLACYWAFTGDRERSLRLLRRALDLGFQEALDITQEPAWSALRGDPAFESCVETVRTRLGIEGSDLPPQ